MHNENISDRESLYLVIIFILGTASIVIRGIEAKQDLWLSIIIAVLMALILSLFYSRLHTLFPKRDLFDILQICFGKIIGKAMSLLYIWFAFHLGTLIITDFGYFLSTISFPETPLIVINIIGSLTAMYAVRSGIEVIARWCELFLPILLLLTIAFILLVIPEMNINNLLPILSSGIKPIMKGALSAFAYPFAEIIVFMMILNNFQTKNSPYKIYSKGLLFSGIPLLVLGIVYILVLGVNSSSVQYFPAHLVASRISIGGVLERTEIVTDIVFIIATFAKLCICLLAACNGISKVLGNYDYRILVFPIGLNMVNLSYFLHDSVIEWLEWGIAIWAPFALPFQVFIPIVLLIVAEIRVRLK